MQKQNLLIEGIIDLIPGQGIWMSAYKSTAIWSIESSYQPEILREYGISDFIVNGDDILIKWFKRPIPLTDAQVKAKYGK